MSSQERDIRTAEALIVEYAEAKAKVMLWVDTPDAPEALAAVEAVRSAEAAILLRGNSIIARPGMEVVKSADAMGIAIENDETTGEPFRRKFHVVRGKGGNTLFMIHREYDDGQRDPNSWVNLTRVGVRQFIDVLQRSLRDPADWGLGSPGGMDQ